MRKWVDARWFQRLLEVIPGLSVWIVIIFPFAFAYPLPLVVAYFILVFNLYWFLKAFNIARHLINGLFYMKQYMRTDWLKRARFVSKDLRGFHKYLISENKKSPNRYLKKEIKEIANLKG